MVIVPTDKYQKRNVVILIAGKAGAGKTTVANFMRQSIPMNYSSMVSSFALGIKTSAQQMGWNSEKDEKGRRLLQQLGNAGREYNKNTWVKLTMDVVNRMTSPITLDFLFIDDWRFPNEYEWFTDKTDMYGVYKIRIHRKDEELLNANDKDVSEISLPEVLDVGYYDYHIVNKNMNLEELHAHSRYMLQHIIDTEFSEKEVINDR